jgi:catechol 2,3-dioxygenase-like lactoylglutathione lyase family enzyme
VPTAPDVDGVITFLFVTDLGASHLFYGDLLGLDLAVDQGDCRIYRVTGGGYLGICERPDRVGTDGLIITLVLDDVDGMHDRLAGAGVPVEAPPTHSDRYGIRHAFYRDPDGHSVEIQRFDDPDWGRSTPRA